MMADQRVTVCTEIWTRHSPVQVYKEHSGGPPGR